MLLCQPPPPSRVVCNIYPICLIQIGLCKFKQGNRWFTHCTSRICIGLCNWFNKLQLPVKVAHELWVDTLWVFVCVTLGISISIRMLIIILPLPITNTSHYSTQWFVKSQIDLNLSVNMLWVVWQTFAIGWTDRQTYRQRDGKGWLVATVIREIQLRKSSFHPQQLFMDSSCAPALTSTTSHRHPPPPTGMYLCTQAT